MSQVAENGGGDTDVGLSLYRSKVAALEQLLEAQDQTVIEQSERIERESQQMYRKIFDYSNEAILVSDPAEDCILDANPSACRLLGYSEQEILSTKLSAIHPHDLAQLKSFAISVLEHGVGWTNEITCVAKNGRAIPAEISASSIEIGDKPCIVALVRDITERRSTEQALQEIAVLEERNRLARELHDSVTQSLYSLTLFAEAGQRLIRAGDLAQVQDYMGQLGITSQQALKEMRLLVYQLRTVALEKQGIVGALRQRLDAVERRAGVEAELVVEGAITLSQTLEQEMFRVLQEALNNALKHSSATKVCVLLSADANAVVGSVEDNGVGFDTDLDNESGGMGIRNMRDRIAALGGTMRLISSVGSGTTVRVSIPNAPDPSIRQGVA